MPTRFFRVAGVLAAGAITLSACGSGSGSHASASSPAPVAAKQAAAPATVKVSSAGGGQVLVDAGGMTVYRFDKDAGATSNCNGTCAVTWPALTVAGAPSGPAGLGVTTRADGASQVTYQGHPLYRYAGDQRPGDTNGDGIGGIWHVVHPGAAAAAAPAPATTPTTPITAASSYSY